MADREPRSGRPDGAGVVSNSFLIQGPALLSFSGGNTSRDMVERIIEAHGGKLPDDVWIAFANTGKEDERTLTFVDQNERHWGERVFWIEYQAAEPGYRVVDFVSASRAGEPFGALIEKKGFVPNRGAPYCSIELKARTIRNFVRDTYGVRRWQSVIGLRRDEELRVMGAIGRNQSGKDPWRNAMPLYEAGVLRVDVMARAAAHPIQLALAPYEGNCVHCWKKSIPKRVQLIRDALRRNDLSDLLWWDDWERRTGTTFLPGLSVRDLIDRAQNEPLLPLDIDMEGDEECGFTCVIADADLMELAD